MGLTLITGPASEPITLTEAKAHCRVDISTDDTYITGLIVAARIQAEVFLRRALITQTWEYTLDEWPRGDSIEMPLPPLQSITSIKYTDLNAVEATLSSSYYYVATKGTPGRVVLNWGYSWPSTQLRSAEGITIRFVCGYLAAANVLDTVKQGIKLLVGHWYENREATVIGTSAVELPYSVKMLWWGAERHFA